MSENFFTKIYSQCTSRVSGFFKRYILVAFFVSLLILFPKVESFLLRENYCYFNKIFSQGCEKRFSQKLCFSFQLVGQFYLEHILDCFMMISNS